MNRRFDERLNELISLKGQNTQFFTSTSYTEMIQKVKSSKCIVSNKKTRRLFNSVCEGSTL